jgi:hypothetical protein
MLYDARVAPALPRRCAAQRTTRKRAKAFTVTVDTAWSAVVSGCIEQVGPYKCTRVGSRTVAINGTPLRPTDRGTHYTAMLLNLAWTM